jgi:CRISPR-associated protein Cas2
MKASISQATNPSTHAMSRHITHAIIAYDITCPRRLQKVYRKLCGHAMRLQYSVFYFTGTQTQYQACLNDIVPLIDEANDDLRAYPLPANGYQWRLGKATLPEGICYTGLPSAWTALHMLEDTVTDTFQPTSIHQEPLTQVIVNNAFFIT